ncbi:hypothetical protein ACSBR2_038767 [Camellia fascicularis]
MTNSGPWTLSSSKSISPLCSTSFWLIFLSSIYIGSDLDLEKNSKLSSVLVCLFICIFE